MKVLGTSQAWFPLQRSQALRAVLGYSLLTNVRKFLSDGLVWGKRVDGNTGWLAQWYGNSRGIGSTNMLGIKFFQNLNSKSSWISFTSKGAILCGTALLLYECISYPGIWVFSQIVSKELTLEIALCSLFLWLGREVVWLKPLDNRP